MMCRLIAVLLLLTLVGLSSACTAIADPPTPANPTRSTQAGKFPDMSGYTAANPDDYQIRYETPGRPGAERIDYRFRTPDGVGCAFDHLPLAVCSGNNLPSIPPVCNPPQINYGANEMSTDGGLRKIGAPCDLDSPITVLPPFHTLTVYGVTCGVDDSGTTACKDPQGRGFVLSPSWSGWLPKV
jgi:hypothetical protein